MDGDLHLSDALQALPIFPLPDTVFFPHTLLPLHVFEPRYRQMTEHVIHGHQHMAVVLVDALDGLPDLHDLPERPEPAVCVGLAEDLAPRAGADRAGAWRADRPIATRRPPVAGLGRVVHHERLTDGRYHILLQGVGRVALDEELPMGDLLYRRMRARLLPSTSDEACDKEMSTLRSCYTRLLEVFPECKENLGDLPLRIREACVLADIVCAAVLNDVAARQSALAETCTAQRLARASDALATMLLHSIGTEPACMN